ncbi:pentapeptide repeat-containing protein [Bradyrhizobium sp. LA7.1]|uniref:pentapeptide repeat-containing protein n=1 Tax=Bradyrhizobium sp. LA7.1 TaxID=3156324 RepID=UPI00339770CF
MTTNEPAGGQIQPGPLQKKEPSRISFGLAQLIVGVAVGVAITWAFLFATLDHAASLIDGTLHIFLLIIVVLGLLLSLAIPITIWVARRFFTHAHGTIEQVLLDSAAAVRATAERDVPTAVTHVERAINEGFAWYAPIAARRWVARTALGLLVAFGGLTGTALLFRQTLLLGEQNKLLQEQILLLRDQNTKIDLQNVTAEAQRRAALLPELLSILQDAAKQVKDKEEKGEVRPITLDVPLAARIYALSRIATPYWMMEPSLAGRAEVGLSPPRLSDRQRSPERGQLLVGLLAAGVDVSSMGHGPDFSASDLRDAVLRGYNMSGINLDFADLRGADMSRANLSRANLSSADLGYRQVVLLAPGRGSVNTTLTKLSNADLRGTKFVQADLEGAQMDGAQLGCVELFDSCTSFSGAVVTRFTDLEGATVDRAETTRLILPHGWELFDENGSIKLRRSNGSK